MGIEDYAAQSPARAMSAVRNFYAGVLLLAKEVLVRAAPNADPDEIIGARYAPEPDGLGGVRYALVGFQTVDFTTIGKRFKDFDIPISTKQLDELNLLRNAIEHRYTEEPASVVREAIARAFPVVAALFQQAQEQPAQVLGDTWAVMLDAREFYQAELKRCRDTLQGVAWASQTVADEHLRCSACGSDLIEQRDTENTFQDEMELLCSSCGIESDRENVIVDAVSRALSGETYNRAKDTGDPGPIYDCPSCSNEAYIDFENRCAVCAEEFNFPSECMRCFNDILLDDALSGFDEGLCSYCTYVMGKND